jgi:hypothetical protein
MYNLFLDWQWERGRFYGCDNFFFFFAVARNKQYDDENT